MKTNRCHAILFDLDGTLIDSSRDLIHSLNLTLRQLNFPAIDYTTGVPFIGDGIQMLIKRALAYAQSGKPETEVDGTLLDRAEKLYHKMYRKHMLDTTLPYPFVAETLVRLIEIPLAVISNKAFVYTQAILTHFGMDRYFSLILGGDSLPRKKPDPQPLLHAARRFRIEPQHCLMVGDSEKDIIAAKNAGIPVCAVTFGLSPKETLRAQNPDYLIDRMTDLLKIVI
ncbi:MAG: phosphoglycolate phosphatase [Fidelibacterota bacterium]